MKMVQLVSRPDGAVLATVRMDSGEDVAVFFTTEQAQGITVANPDPVIFNREPMDAADTRALVAAVVAFDRVAVYGTWTSGAV